VNVRVDLKHIANITEIVTSPLDDWRGSSTDAALQSVIEHGGVVAFPSLAFAVSDDERSLFDASLADEERKSIYIRSGRNDLTGTTAVGVKRDAVRTMIERFAASSHALVDGLFPDYAARSHATGTSFRPRAIGDVSSGRALSWRKDDTRLHVDAFPSNPTHGDRILRVFTNVHPGTMPRAWRVGESFESMAARFLPRTRDLPPGGAWLMHRLSITKRPRSAYDHLMLQLHDLAKGDLDYQRTSPQRDIDFLPGTTWICFSDQVMHAAMSGQFMFEQTYRLPLATIAEPGASPLRVLERMTGRSLV
jgi:hypothetical protein